MLGDDVAAHVDQGLGGLTLDGGIIPGVGEKHVHGHVRVDAARAKEVGVHGVDALGDLHGGHIAEVVVLGAQARGDAGQIARFPDAAKVVGEVDIVGEVAGAVQEDDLRVLLRQLGHVGAKAEAVAEDDVAALLDQFKHGVFAGAVLGDVGLDEDLIVAQAQSLLHLQRTLVVCQSVALVAGVADVDEADLDLIRGNGLESQRRTGKGEHEQQGQHQSNQFLHGLVPPNRLLNGKRRTFRHRMLTKSTDCQSVEKARKPRKQTCRQGSLHGRK